MKETLKKIVEEIERTKIKLAKLKLKKMKKIIELREKKLTFRQIGKQIGVSRQRIHELLNY